MCRYQEEDGTFPAVAYLCADMHLRKEARPMMSAFPVKGVPLPLAWIAALVLAGMGPTMARAQGVVPSASASAGSPVGDPAPRPVVVPSDVLDFGEPEAAIPAIPGSPACVPGTLPARVVMGPLDVIHESIFGPASKEEWHPLSLSTFFSEGWDEAYVSITFTCR